MAPDLLSAPDKVALPGLSLAFPFGEPLLLPIKTVLVDLFRYCSSERAAFRNSRKSLRCVLGTRRYLPIMFLESQLGISLHLNLTYSMMQAGMRRVSAEFARLA
jgi:hypothetical protein